MKILINFNTIQIQSKLSISKILKIKNKIKQSQMLNNCSFNHLIKLGFNLNS